MDTAKRNLITKGIIFVDSKGNLAKLVDKKDVGEAEEKFSGEIEYEIYEHKGIKSIEMTWIATEPNKLKHAKKPFSRNSASASLRLTSTQNAPYKYNKTLVTFSLLQHAKNLPINSNPLATGFPIYAHNISLNPNQKKNVSPPN